MTVSSLHSKSIWSGPSLSFKIGHLFAKALAADPANALAAKEQEAVRLALSKLLQQKEQREQNEKEEGKRKRRSRDEKMRAATSVKGVPPEVFWRSTRKRRL